MAFALRHRISLVLVVVTLLATGGVFAFARPQAESRDESEMIDFSERRYYSPDVVRRTFAAEGIHLRFSSSFGGMLTLSNEARPLRADALQVVVAPRTGTGSWGPELEPHDERFGNVLVTYGGDDERLLAGVKAAVSALR